MSALVSVEDTLAAVRNLWFHHRTEWLRLVLESRSACLSSVSVLETTTTDGPETALKTLRSQKLLDIEN